MARLIYLDEVLVRVPRHPAAPTTFSMSRIRADRVDTKAGPHQIRVMDLFEYGPSDRYLTGFNGRHNGIMLIRRMEKLHLQVDFTRCCIYNAAAWQPGGSCHLARCECTDVGKHALASNNEPFKSSFLAEPLPFIVFQARGWASDLTNEHEKNVPTGHVLAKFILDERLHCSDEGKEHKINDDLHYGCAYLGQLEAPRTPYRFAHDPPGFWSIYPTQKSEAY